MAEHDVGVGLYKQAEARLAAGEVAIATRLAGRAREVLAHAQEMDSACAAATLEGRIHLLVGNLPAAGECIDWVLEHGSEHELNGRVLSAMTDRGTLLEAVGDINGAVETHVAVLAMMRQQDDLHGIATAAGNVGRLMVRLMRFDEARALLDEAQQLFGQLQDGPGIINVVICIGDLERGLSRLEPAREAFETAVALADSDGLALLRSVALLNLGHVMRDLGQAAQALQAFDSSHEITVRHGDVQGAARARLAQAMVLADSDSPARSIEAFEEAEAAFMRLGQPTAALAASVNRCAVLCRVGRLLEGRDGLEHARHMLQIAGDERAVVEVSMALCEVHIALGDAASAEELLESIGEDAGGPRLQLRRALISAKLSVRAGLLADSRAILDRVQLETCSMAEQMALQMLDCEAKVFNGDRRASKDLAELLATLEPVQQPREYAAVRSLNGIYELWRGDLHLAEASFREALARWQSLGEPLAAMQAKVGIWRVDALLGRELSAAEISEAAQQLVERNAADAAASMQVLAATAVAVSRGREPEEQIEVDDETGPSAAVSVAVFPLLSSGNRLAAMTELALAATVTGDVELRKHANELFDSTDIVAPVWFDSVDEP